MHATAVVAVGLGATLFMDVVAIVLTRILGGVPPSYCLVGRWIGHMRHGTFTHASIANALPESRECALGWIAHYLIGVVYALMLVAGVSIHWIAHPTLLPALVFGIATVAIPFLVMQPSFGLGIAASKTPHPAQARLRSLMAHTTFGIGLYVAAVVTSRLLPLDS